MRPLPFDKRRHIGWTTLRPSAVLGGYGHADGDCEATQRQVALGSGWVVTQAHITNRRSRPVHIRGIRWTGLPPWSGAFPLKFPSALDPFYFATENLHGEFFGTGTTGDDCYFKPLPRETVEIGWSEDSGFPCLFIGSKKVAFGLLCAAASQERFHSIFRLRGWDGRNGWAFEIEEHPTGTGVIEIAPGETVFGEKMFFSLARTSDPQHSTVAYFTFLRSEGLFDRRDKFNPLPSQRIWCSWNYDYFPHITEEAVLKQLPILNRHFPSVKFVQLDDGYQRTFPTGRHAQIDFLYQTDEPFDRRKFPHGPKALVRSVKEAGLRPALWLGLWAARESEMMRDHPDWILLDDTGRPMTVNHTCILDPSVPAVRRYLQHVCRTVIVDWGFEGIKLDFSTFAFNCKRARFRNTEKTGAQWRHWLADTFRSYLPRDGFFGWCVVAGTANPFLAPQADYFRCAIDITYEHGNQSWDVVKRIASWCANTNMLFQQRPVLPNMDSIGWNRSFRKTDWLTWLNLCTVNGGALEVSGDLTKLDRPKLERLNRVLELSDSSRRVWCVDVLHGKNLLPPSVWIAEGRHDTLLGLFNWNDHKTDLSPWLSALRSSFPRRLRGKDAWDGKRVALQHHSNVFRLTAHESRLYVLD